MENTTKDEKNVEPTPGEPVVEKPKVEKPAEPKVEKPAEPKVDAKKAEEDAKIAENQKVTLLNVLGKEVALEDYFYKGIVPPGFKGTCGNPVDREDLLTVFNKVFKPEDNILFYRQADKEVYIIIVPIKYATEIGDFNDSIEGDFQKHAISFLSEGSVNLDSLRLKLEKINKFVKYSDR